MRDDIRGSANRIRGPARPAVPGRKEGAEDGKVDGLWDDVVSGFQPFPFVWCPFLGPSGQAGMFAPLALKRGTT